MENILVHYEVISVSSGKDALEVIATQHVDLILLDIMMPHMNGYEVCDILKSSDKFKNIPIIFITAKTDENSMDTALNLGAIDYVTKPFIPKELLTRVKVQLKLNYIKNQQEPSTIHLNNNYKWNRNTNSLSHQNSLIKLSRYESLFIQCLVDKINQAVSYEDIHTFIYNLDDYSLSAITSIVKRIRQKTTKDFIQSSFKFGYKIESN